MKKPAAVSDAALASAGQARNGTLSPHSWILVVCGAVSVAGLLWGMDRLAAHRSNSQVSSAPAERQSDAENEALLRRVEALERELRNRDREARSERAGTSSEPMQAPSSANESVEATAAADEARMAVYESRVADAVRNEARDPTTSAALERDLRARIAQVDVAVSFDSISCGDTLCSISFTHDDEGAHLKVFGALLDPQSNERPVEGLGGPSLMRRHPRPDGGYSTTIYAAQAGESLPAFTTP